MITNVSILTISNTMLSEKANWIERILFQPPFCKKQHPVHQFSLVEWFRHKYPRFRNCLLNLPEVH